MNYRMRVRTHSIVRGTWWKYSAVGTLISCVSAITGNEAADLIILTLVVISENPENLRCGSESYDRLQNIISTIVSSTGKLAGSSSKAHLNGEVGLIRHGTGEIISGKLI